MSDQDQETEVSAVPETPSFLQTGFDATTAPIAEAEAQAAANRKTWRFWLPAPKAGETTMADIIFLTEEPVSFREHQVPLNGEWGKHYFTCIQGHLDPETGKAMDCPLCMLSEHQAYFAAAWVIVDLREYLTKRTKEKRSNEKRILVAKSQVIKTLKRQAEKREGLLYAQYETNRTGEKAPNTGDDWDFTKQFDLDQMKEKFAAEIEKFAKNKQDFLGPLDFAKEFAPLSLKELEEIYQVFTKATSQAKDVKF